ncbi:MAG: DUF1385 domain-containing protein [Chloroflexota bacterium]
MSNKTRPFYYGGQAVYEGVMIRGQKHLATAVRVPSGQIAMDTRPLPSLYLGRLRRTPFVRGTLVLLETLVLGTQALLRSADLALAEEEVKVPTGAVWGAVAAGLALGVALFLVAPLLIARYTIFPFTSPLVGNILEGLLRIAMFVAYLKATRLLPDLKRIYAYHGAEHKVVNAFESGEPLELESARRYPTAHTRCGTSFVLIVFTIAILVYALAGRPSIWVSITLRIVLLPVIVGIGYEIVRFAANHGNNRYVRMLLSPGLALQSMTTAEPADDQIEVALAAMKSALATDSAGQPTASEDAQASPGAPIPS